MAKPSATLPQLPEYLLPFSTRPVEMSFGRRHQPRYGDSYFERVAEVRMSQDQSDLWLVPAELLRKELLVARGVRRPSSVQKTSASYARSAAFEAWTTASQARRDFEAAHGWRRIGHRARTGRTGLYKPPGSLLRSIVGHLWPGGRSYDRRVAELSRASFRAMDAYHAAGGGAFGDRPVRTTVDRVREVIEVQQVARFYCLATAEIETYGREGARLHTLTDARQDVGEALWKAELKGEQLPLQRALEIAADVTVSLAQGKSSGRSAGESAGNRGL